MRSDRHNAILIVEDDHGTALLHCNCLKRRGFTAVSAASSDEAMRVLQDNDIQLIVLDNRLSDGTTGLEFCNVLKAAGCTVPIVIVTGFSQEETAVEALRAGVRDYVTKSPDYLDYLPEAVERVLRQVDVERKLAHSESRLSAIINSSQDAIIVVDEMGVIALFNPAAEEIFHCGAQSAIGTPVTRFLSGPLPFALGEEGPRTDSRGDSHNDSRNDMRREPFVHLPRATIEGKRADGSLVSLELSATHWVEQEKAFATLVVRDITRQKRAEEALHASEERFRAFMDNGPAVAFIKDCEGRYVYVNARFTEVFGLSLAEVQGRTVADIFPPPIASRLWANDQAAVHSNVVVRQIESVPTRDNEERAWMTFRFSFAGSTSDRLIGGVAIDITEQKRAEESLRLREEQLRKTQRIEAVGTLAGGIAHEFGNLLQAIQGYATFAIQGLPAGEQRYQDLKQLLKAVDQAAALTRQILGFGRRQPLNLADVDLNELVEDLVAMIRPLIGSQINVAFARDDSIGRVLADPDQLRQMLIDLCVNARDAMPAGGNLLLRTERRRITATPPTTRPEVQPGQYVVVSVRDDGCGMSDTVKDHIFEPFFTAKEVGKGTGLGLALAYGIVRQHGGAIDVKSEPARGSTFDIYLPAATYTAPAPPAETARERNAQQTERSETAFSEVADLDSPAEGLGDDTSDNMFRATPSSAAFIPHAALDAVS